MSFTITSSNVHKEVVTIGRDFVQAQYGIYHFPFNESKFVRFNVRFPEKTIIAIINGVVERAPIIDITVDVLYCNTITTCKCIVDSLNRDHNITINYDADTKVVFALDTLMSSFNRWFNARINCTDDDVTIVDKVDPLGEYVKVHILGHVGNIVGGDRDRLIEYVREISHYDEQAEFVIEDFQCSKRNRVLHVEYDSKKKIVKCQLIDGDNDVHYYGEIKLEDFVTPFKTSLDDSEQYCEEQVIELDE